MLINAIDPEESRIAVVEDGVLQELHVEIANRETYLGNIYKAKVVNIEPSIGAAFVAFGGRSNGFLHSSDVLPAYGDADFRLQDVVEGRAHATGSNGPDVVRAVIEDNDDDGDDADDADGAPADDVPEEKAVAANGGEGDSKPGGGGTATTRASRTRGRREQKRTAQPIDSLLRKGQELVVQVTKEGIGAKGPTLTTYVSLPGRSLVLMPSLPKCGVSRKIEQHKERRRLKKIVRELDNTGKGGMGFIVRTAGVDKSKADLERDRDYLNKIWGLVAQRLQATRAPALLYQESDLVLKAMRDLFSPDIEEVVVDSKDVYLRIRDFAEKLMPKMAERIRLHESSTPVFHSFGIEGEVQGLYQPRVELKSGISIVIDQTEALVAIDINSGRFKPSNEFEETAYRTNLEAVPEIVRQVRLRDLGGVIVIDFIDMSDEKKRRAIERKLIEALKGDRARIKVGRISPFGMLELTRQRVGPGLKHTVFSTCSHCQGSGLSRTVSSRAVATLREMRAMLHLKGFSVLQVFTAPAVEDFLSNHKRRSLIDLEEGVGKRISIRSQMDYPVDMVHYRFLTADGQEAKVAIPAGLGVRV